MSKTETVTVALPHWTSLATWTAFFGAVGAAVTALVPGVPHLAPIEAGCAAGAVQLVSLVGTVRSGKGPLVNRLLVAVSNLPEALLAALNAVEASNSSKPAAAAEASDVKDVK